MDMSSSSLKRLDNEDIIGRKSSNLQSKKIDEKAFNLNTKLDEKTVNLDLKKEENSTNLNLNSDENSNNLNINTDEKNIISNTQTDDNIHTQNISFNVTSYLKNIQTKNGLKYQDFLRYWRYCTKRLKHLKIKLHLSNSKKGYQKKTLPSQFSDIRYLKLILLNAERAWSHAQHLKSEQSTATSTNGKLRFHAIRRFSKAAAHSKLLYDLCINNCDKYTQLNAQAYNSKINALKNIEKKKFKIAAEDLLISHNLYTQLMRLSMGDNYNEQIYKDQLEDLEPYIRLCEYNLGNNFKQINNKINRIVDTNKQTDGNISSSNISNQIFLSHRNTQISLSSIDKPEIKTSILNCKQQFDNKCISFIIISDKNINKITSLNPNTIIEDYGAILTEYNNIAQSIRMHMLTTSVDTVFSSLQGFLFDMKTTISIERNLLLLIIYFAKFNFKDEEIPSINFEEGLRYVDLLNEDLFKMIENENEIQTNNSSDIVISLQWCLEIAKYCKAFCLSILCYSQKSFDDSVVLSDYASYIQDYTDISYDNDNIDDYFKRIFFLFGHLKKSISLYIKPLQFRCISKCVQEYNNIHIKPITEASVNVKRIKLSDKEQFPPPPIKMSCKPFLFDIAFDLYNPPDISHRCKTQETKGLMGRLRAFWK